MRVATLVTLPLLGALIALPMRAPAQITIRFGTRLGPEVTVFAYSPERYGNRRDRYGEWTPVTLYDVNGHYYRYQVDGARAVQVYLHDNEYFMPPQDREWVGRDRRYNYQRQPGDVDYGRARPYTPDAVVNDPRLGQEIGVLGYSQERAGDWRTNYRRWTPVTVYEVRGHYFSKNAPGARAVAIYRYRNEYFLPPNDQEWVGRDRRFNYDRRPGNEDYGRVRERP